MPDEAVTFGGIVRHSSGSRIVTAGHIKLVRDAVLEARFLVRHDEAAVHLAARAGGGREQDRRQRRHATTGFSMEVIEGTSRRSSSASRRRLPCRARFRRQGRARRRSPAPAPARRRRRPPNCPDFPSLRRRRCTANPRSHPEFLSPSPRLRRCAAFCLCRAADSCTPSRASCSGSLRRAPVPKHHPCGQIKLKSLFASFKTSQHSSRRLRRGGDGIPVVVNPIRARRAICRREKMPGGFRLVFFAGIFYNLT